jgi:hypothetical protein
MSAFYYLVPAESRFRLVHESWPRYLHRRLFQPGKRYPSGGVQVIYRHVALLKKLGWEAHAVHLGRFRVDWFEHDVKPISLAQARSAMRPGDAVVVPEYLPRLAETFACRQKLAFAQNWGYVAKAIGGGDYADYGFTGVLCCGAYMQEWMARRTALPVWLVGNGIDLEKFTPDPAIRRPGRLLFLRRKPSWVLGPEAVARLDPGLRRGLEVVASPNRLALAQMIQAYRQADIFLALGFPEGFALPPLEAMACGCAVVGFTGGGGSDFMHDGETALVVPDGDAGALAKALGRVLADSDLKEVLRRNGRREALRFGLGAMEENLMRFAQSVLS